MATNSVLAKLAVQISANTADFNKSLSATQKNLQSFTGGISKIAGAVGVAFGVQEVASFALEVSKLAGEAQGVRAAFERLPQATKLMEDLKRATGGTVSELDLMKRAVQANNFEISLAALPRLLEFATLRAQQTGQSVDYLVDSIVTGIGRKSKLILDNLGISAVQLNEALGGASTAASTIGEVADAVGKIAEDNLKNMAGFSENASTKLQRLEASWINVKVALGDAANGTGILGTALDNLGEQLDVLSSRNIPNYLKVLNLMLFGIHSAALAQIDLIKKQIPANKEQKKQEQIIREVDRAYKEFNGDIDAYGKAISTHIYKTELLAEFTKRLNSETDKQTNTYAELKEQLDELNQQFETATDKNDKKALTNIGAKIIAINKEIEALDKLRKAEKAKDPLEGKFKFLPDLEAEGSTNPELRNEQALNEMKEFNAELKQTTEEMGGVMIKLEEASGETTKNIATQWLDMSGNIASAITTVADSFGQAIVGVGNFGDTIIKALVGFARQIGETLIAIGVGMLAAKQAIKNPYTAIAAGVALVALSGAMAAGMQSAQNNFNGGGGAPGFRPSEIQANVDIRGRTRGSDLVYTTEKEGYRRSRVG